MGAKLVAGADIVVERGADRERRGARHQERISVGIGAGGRARGERAAGTGTIFKDHLLTDRR